MEGCEHRSSSANSTAEAVDEDDGQKKSPQQGGLNVSVGILAPVPAVILKSALKTCSREGRVAFGTNAGELFARIEEGYGSVPVLIYPTRFFGDPDGLCTPAFVSF